MTFLRAESYINGGKRGFIPLSGRCATNPAKIHLARVFDAIGLNASLLRLQSVAGGPYVRSVNYHDVPASLAREFEDQLRFYSERFVSVGYRDLQELLVGRWPHDRPGLMITFDDGLRSHFEVAAPLLERYGWVGWFFIPVGFIDASPEQQREFASEHQLDHADESPEPRIAMTWDEIRRLDRNHVIGCHTHNHTRLSESLSPEQIETEIPAAKQRLEQRLGHSVDSFAWVGGEEWSYSREAAEAISRAGFDVSFMTNHAAIRAGCDPLQIQRTNVEAHHAPSVVRLHLSGFMDLLYTAKRRRVTRLTRTPGGESGVAPTTFNKEHGE